MGTTTIAVIDDESLVRLGILSAVDWERHGYQVVGEEENGQAGWEMIQKKRPDIVFLDICMPVMDGIEVLRRIHGSQLECKVVVLSCHDDFAYVREAMKNGAWDYLRKSEINSTNILDILEEIRQSLPQKTPGESVSAREEEWEHYHVKYTYLQRLLIGHGEECGPVPVEELAVTERSLYCVVFAVAHYQQVIERYEEGYPFTLEHSLVNLSREVVRQHCSEMELFLLQENQYVLLLSGREQGEVVSLLDELYAIARNYLNASLRFGIHGPVRDFSRLPEAFAGACHSQCLHFFRPEQRQIQEDVPAASPPDLQAMLRKLPDALGQREQAFLQLDELFRWLERHKEENLEAEKIRETLEWTVQELFRREGKEADEIIQRVQHCEDLSQTQSLIQALQDEEREDGQPLRNHLIRDAAQYIQQNLSRGDISLDEIAEHLLISKSYLCRLFQKNLGISAQRYIHNIRIEKAKEYLKDSHMKIYEIAERTGFNSSTHFNVVFKKIMGCTPVEYRNHLRP